MNCMNTRYCYSIKVIKYTISIIATLSQERYGTAYKYRTFYDYVLVQSNSAAYAITGYCALSFCVFISLLSGLTKIIIVGVGVRIPPASIHSVLGARTGAHTERQVGTYVIYALKRSRNF